MNPLLETLREETFVLIEEAKAGVPRKYEFPHADNMIKVAIGMRRSGKTYFLYQTIHKLLNQGIAKEQIFFINFEDDRLLPMSAKEMGLLLDSFYSLYPENHHRTCYLFLDEIQNIPDWHLVIRRYFDSKNVQIYLTGSSSKLLSQEIHTNLRGRSLATEILPFNLQEYFIAHQITPKKTPFGQAAFDIMQKHLTNYFLTGGFPAVQLMAQNEWQETLRSYIDTTILRDIVERHKVSNIPLLKYLITTLLKNSATLFSINKFYNDITSQGYKINKDTLHNYLDYIQEAFLIFTVPFYTESLRAKQNKPKKIYAIDSGLIHIASLGINDLYGKLFENLIYLDLRRQKKEIYFYTTQEGYEIDFVTKDLSGNRELLQVAWDTSDKKALEREEHALISAEKELGITGKIITPEIYLKNQGQL